MAVSGSLGNGASCDMITSSNGNIFRVTGPLCGEFTGPGEFPTQRPVTRSFDVYFDLRLNKRLSKQPWSWWFETLSWSLWRQCNELKLHYNDVILSAMTFQITGVSIVCSIVCSGADQRKHKSSASLAFVRGIHWWPVSSPNTCPITLHFPLLDLNENLTK